MSSGESRGEKAERRARRLRFRIPFFLTSLVALGVLVTLPFSVTVIIFTLGAIMVRALLYIHDEADMALVRRARR